jgi:RimK family alpha-L-glutamate ligase
MHIAVLGSASSWYVDDLRRAAGDRHEIVPVAYQELGSRVDAQGISVNSSRQRKLSDFAAVLVRSMPPGSLEQVVFRMDALANLAAAGVRVVNPPRAIEVAVDKYLATTRLHDAGLLVPPTVVCQTAEQALVAFGDLGGDVVVKPLFGSEGRGITRVTDEAVALRVFRSLEQIGSALYLQQFVPHEGCDWRLLVLGDEVLGMQRRHPHDWRTNISRGAVGEPLQVTAERADLAQRAARAVGATLAGVDLLPGKDGQLYAIEVNAVPGWRALAEVTGVDVAERVLRQIQGE